MTKTFLAVTILFVVTFFTPAFAQQLPDSTAYNHALSVYLSGIGNQSEILRGVYYTEVTSQIGSVFFMDRKEWAPATIVYDGHLYKDVPVMYDCYNDILISRKEDKLTGYVFRPEKLTAFRLHGHQFKRLDPQSVKNASDYAYYDELYSGKSSVIVKRSKTRSEDMSQRSVRVIFEDKNTIYIKKNGVYIPVQSRGDVLKVFKDKEDLLKKYIKSAALNFSDNRELAVTKLATYYDQLSL